MQVKYNLSMSRYIVMKFKLCNLYESHLVQGAVTGSMQRWYENGYYLNAEVKKRQPMCFKKMKAKN